MVRVEPVQVDETIAEVIAGIVNRSFAVEAWFVDGDRITPAGVIRLAAEQGGQFLVACAEDGQPVGCAYCEVREGGRGYFGLLAVNAEFQGGGVGFSLVRGAEQYLRNRGCHAVEITVVDLRTELFPYYEKRGYRLDGRTQPFPREAKHPCVLIYMTKELG